MEIKEIVSSIRDGSNEYFSMGCFNASNIADYTLMSAIVDDLVRVYGIDGMDAIEIIQELTHN